MDEPYFVLTIIFSFVISYFISKALLLNDSNNTTTNLNKIYMALLMATFTGLFQSGIMLTKNRSVFNIALLIFFIIVSAILIICIKKQLGIDQEQFLLSMIEHHSTGIGMSEKAKEKVSDHRVKTLINNIIQNQEKEIADMKNILNNPINSQNH
jgi:hypothetical protein